ncbi:probable LRR receptor-like serine/threonine-protein kinase At5g37450 [Pistacia vera]|uniref:probable LRR receptor-like serine/threonine-protein kinase At5g37450 n=1 Tax=Pistacia vera TaxID=55513 RepID=UPI001262BB88|nr:probable LRR receptor-like serine/threonine-protein kinase At5g37450 [Pistacia vera]
MPRWRFSLIGIILVLLPCHFLQLASAQITHPLEVNALQAVRRALKDTGKNLNSWKKTDPCVSNWTGVICLMDPNDGHLHVQELRLLNMKLSGKLAPSLGLFSHMTVLNFMWNNLTGSIPKEIGNLITLKLL